MSRIQPQLPPPNQGHVVDAVLPSPAKPSSSGADVQAPQRRREKATASLHPLKSPDSALQLGKSPDVRQPPALRLDDMVRSYLALQSTPKLGDAPTPLELVSIACAVAGDKRTASAKKARSQTPMHPAHQGRVSDLATEGGASVQTVEHLCRFLKHRAEQHDEVGQTCRALYASLRWGQLIEFDLHTHAHLATVVEATLEQAGDMTGTAELEGLMPEIIERVDAFADAVLGALDDPNLMKTTDGRLAVPLRLQGHFVVLEITQAGDGNFSLELFNRGAGAELNGPKDGAHVAGSYRLTQLSRLELMPLLRGLARATGGGTLYVYRALEAARCEGIGRYQPGAKAKRQHAGHCHWKSLAGWLRVRLGTDYPRFKAHFSKALEAELGRYSRALSDSFVSRHQMPSIWRDNARMTKIEKAFIANDVPNACLQARKLLRERQNRPRTEETTGS